MRKTVNFPLPIHLYKFVKASQRYDFIRESIVFEKTTWLNKEIECLKVSHYIPVNSFDKTWPEKWISNIPPDYVWICVEMIDPKLQRLFYLFKLIEDKFASQLVEHMHIQKEINRNAKLGLNKFLDKCDISEEDYKMATGYKHWQRYQKKLKKRQLNAA